MEKLHDQLTTMLTLHVDRYVDGPKKFLAAEEMALIVNFAIAKTKEAMIQEFDRVLCQGNRRALIEEANGPSDN